MKNQKGCQQKNCLTPLFLSAIISPAAKADGEWCNGSTYDSDSYCLGSNPSSPAFLFLAPLSRGLGRGPLKAETRVRIPSELLKTSSRLGGAFVLRISIEDSNGAVVNDSPVDCQSREWPFSAEKVESRRSCFFYAMQIIVCRFFLFHQISFSIHPLCDGFPFIYRDLCIIKIFKKALTFH